MEAERRQVTVLFTEVVGLIAFRFVVSRTRHRHHRLPFFGGGRAGGSSLPRSTLLTQRSAYFSASTISILLVGTNWTMK